MPLEEPSWWYEDETTATARMLMPLARLYARAALRRLDHAQPYRSRLPVICIGNFTAGGTGKTPLTLHVARHLVHLGEQPAILTRGYGGKVSGAHWIDADRDRADVTGDEPLLLARAAPTLISRDRRAGAIAIEASGRDVSVIVMDDGLQNPALTKDLTIAIVDGTRGVGNGLVIPAGPLRAPLDRQLALADAILVNRPPSRANATDARDVDNSLLATLRRDFPGPVLAARTMMSGDPGWLAGSRVVAYAGIANPNRFFDGLAGHGADIVARRAFKDHHAFTEKDARELIALAETTNARLVTTAKDSVRLLGRTGALGALCEASQTIEVELVLDERDAGRLKDLVASAAATGGYKGRFT